MPVDTAKKRKAALTEGAPQTDVPLPDGTIDAGDRGQLTGTYVPSPVSASDHIWKRCYGDVGISCYVMK